MLEQNRLSPPASSILPSPAVVPACPAVFDWQAAVLEGAFSSAEDYDSSGILAGVDPFESRYWWMPELYTSGSVGGESTHEAAANGPAVVAKPVTSDPAGSETGVPERSRKNGQAARRPGSRSPAAA